MYQTNVAINIYHKKKTKKSKKKPHTTTQGQGKGTLQTEPYK